jgi:DNA helicase-4
MRADNGSEEEKLSNIENVLMRINHSCENEANVLILGRYNFNLPKTKAINHLRGQFKKLNISTMTIHSSKGKEADYVVLLDLEAGKNGFPSEKITHPLLEALLPPQQPYNFAEERRIFYVALTRARHRVYLIADMSQPSMFLGELLKKKYPIEVEEFKVSENQMLYQLVNCVECETGSLVPRTGKHGNFFGCSHYPRCKHVENGCSCCGSMMRSEGRYKVCTNNKCDGWVPICPVCNADMVLRKGKYGAFWGCKNYRRHGMSCGHTEKTISPPTIEARGSYLN